MLSELELNELRERCAYSAAHGFQVALAEQYVEELEDEAGAVELAEGVLKNSPEHLVALCDAALKRRGGKDENKGKKAESDTSVTQETKPVHVPSIKPEAPPPPQEEAPAPAQEVAASETSFEGVSEEETPEEKKSSKKRR